MGDISEKLSSGSTKIVGADPLTGSESNYAQVDSNGNSLTRDSINNWIYGELTVGTTPVELKIGVSALFERKIATLDNTSNATIYWGTDSSVSTTHFAGRIFKDQQPAWSATEAASIWLVAGSAGNVVHISEGSS